MKSSLVDFPAIAAAVFTPAQISDSSRTTDRYCADALPFGQEVVVPAEGGPRSSRVTGATYATAGFGVYPPRAPFYRSTDTTQPTVVDALLREGLIDFVALDYKAPFERYPELCGAAADPGPVRRTMALLRERGVAYELRTTFVPQLTVDDIAAMTAEVAPIPRYALQTYRPPEVFRQEDRFRVLATPHPPSALKAAAAAAEPHAGTIVMR